MEIKENNFSCPKCGQKISIKELFNFKKGHETICPRCNEYLMPEKSKSWNWGFFIGFISVIIPGKICLYFFDSFILLMLTGLLIGSIAIICIAYFVYKTTIFKSV